jgi:hypothetical protein
VAIIGGFPAQVDMQDRSLMRVPADEVMSGDVVRDQGVFRRVAGVEPLVVELSLVWSFDPMEGYADCLNVPSLTSVSVWRVRDGR